MHYLCLGCGRVASAAAARLLDAGHEVTAARRTPSEIEQPGIDAVAADVTDPDDLAGLPDADVLVYTASAGSRTLDAARETYVDGLRTVVEEFSSRDHAPERILYTGSTGVYGDRDGGWVDEETPIDPRTEREAVLAEAESVVLEAAPAAGIDGTVLRFAGLYGPGRYRLERYLDGPVVEGYLNMVHDADAAGALATVLERWGSGAELLTDDVLCVADDEPAWRPDFARWLAAECGVEQPAVETPAERVARKGYDEATAARVASSKRVANDRLRGLGDELVYPTYREGYRAAVEAYRDVA